MLDASTWPVIVVGLAVLVAAGGVLAAVGVLRDLRLHRQMDIARGFLEIVGRAHGGALGGSGRVGVGEQLAAMRLMGRLGRRRRWLRGPAIAALEILARWRGAPELEAIGRAAVEELGRLGAVRSAAVHGPVLGRGPTRPQVSGSRPRSRHRR